MIMDKRLEKIRRFEANVMDFESYINDRIKQTRKENKSGKVTESKYQNHSFMPNENIPEERIEYVVSNVE